ncbi:hypothetical protein [Aquamicrobium ahrensii]|uniref:Uncharacterized protein n=1 Tax=Aquamicrobium ahrensii TaxID=469551 RepID=A0ABV2KQF1_9HYPH
MSNRQSPEDWRRERALAALARAMRGEDEDLPKSPAEAGDETPDWRRTAAERHRLARFQRDSAARQEREAEIHPAAPPETPYVVPPTPLEIVTQAEESAPPVSEAAPAESAQIADFPVQEEVSPTPEPPAIVEEQPSEQQERPGHGEQAGAEIIESPFAPDSAEHGETTEEETVVLVRPAIAASRPLILRLTLLGALIGIAAALLLWNSYGAVAAFMPLAGLLVGLAAGLVAALRRPKVAVNAEADANGSTSPARAATSPQDVPPAGGQADSPGVGPAGGGGVPPLGHPPSVEEIRASLRQFRAATQDLARQRSRR